MRRGEQQSGLHQLQLSAAMKALSLMGRFGVASAVYMIIIGGLLALNGRTWDDEECPNEVTPIDRVWRSVWGVLGLYDTSTVEEHIVGSPVHRIMRTIPSQLLPLHRGCMDMTVMLPAACGAALVFRHSGQRSTRLATYTYRSAWLCVLLVYAPLVLSSGREFPYTVQLNRVRASDGVNAVDYVLARWVESWMVPPEWRMSTGLVPVLPGGAGRVHRALVTWVRSVPYLIAGLTTYEILTRVRTRSRGANHCHHCEYDLSGLMHERCPECGTLVGVARAGPRARGQSVDRAPDRSTDDEGRP